MDKEHFIKVYERGWADAAVLCRDVIKEKRPFVDKDEIIDKLVESINIAFDEMYPEEKQSPDAMAGALSANCFSNR